MPWWVNAATFVYLAGLLAIVGAASAARLMPVPGRWAWAAACVLAAGLAFRLAAQVQSAFGEIGITLERIELLLTATPWGRGWMWQAAAVVLVLPPAWAVRKTQARSGSLTVAAVIAAGTAALTGHAVGLTDRLWITVPAHAVHVVAAGLWMGTLGFLVAGLGSAWTAPPGPERRAQISDAVLRFSLLALGVVPLVVLSGLVAGFVHLGELERLWTTSYGRMLMLKVVVFLAAAACGAVNWRLVAPRLATDDRAEPRLRRLAGLEVALGAATLVLTSILVALPMPAE